MVSLTENTLGFGLAPTTLPINVHWRAISQILYLCTCTRALCMCVWALGTQEMRTTTTTTTTIRATTTTMTTATTTIWARATRRDHWPTGDDDDGLWSLGIPARLETRTRAVCTRVYRAAASGRIECIRYEAGKWEDKKVSAFFSFFLPFPHSDRGIFRPHYICQHVNRRLCTMCVRTAYVGNIHIHIYIGGNTCLIQYVRTCGGVTRQLCWRRYFRYPRTLVWLTLGHFFPGGAKTLFFTTAFRSIAFVSSKTIQTSTNVAKPTRKQIKNRYRRLCYLHFETMSSTTVLD